MYAADRLAQRDKLTVQGHAACAETAGHGRVQCFGFRLARRIKHDSDGPVRTGRALKELRARPTTARSRSVVCAVAALLSSRARPAALKMRIILKPQHKYSELIHCRDGAKP